MTIGLPGCPTDLDCLYCRKKTAIHSLMSCPSRLSVENLSNVPNQYEPKVIPHLGDARENLSIHDATYFEFIWVNVEKFKLTKISDNKYRRLFMSKLKTVLFTIAIQCFYIASPQAQTLDGLRQDVNSTKPAITATSESTSVLAQATCNLSAFNACGVSCDTRWKACTGNRGGNDSTVQACRKTYEACVQGCRNRHNCN